MRQQLQIVPPVVPLHNSVKGEYAKPSCRGPDAERGDSADELACGDEINSPAGIKKVDPQLAGGEDGLKDRPLGLGKVETVRGKRGE